MLTKLRFHDERESALFIDVCACLHNFIIHHNKQEFNDEFFDDDSIRNRKDPHVVEQIPTEEDYASSSSSDSDNDNNPMRQNNRVISNSEKIALKYRHYFE